MTHFAMPLIIYIIPRAIAETDAVGFCSCDTRLLTLPTGPCCILAKKVTAAADWKKEQGRKPSRFRAIM